MQRFIEEPTMTSESQTWFTFQPKLFTRKRRGTWRAGCLEIGHVRFGGGRLVPSVTTDAWPPTLRKAARALVQSRDMVAYEALQITHLVKNHHLAKSIRDASWGLFLSWLGYYGHMAGIPIVAVSPHYTTQDCSGCGY